MDNIKLAGEHCNSPIIVNDGYDFSEAQNGIANNVASAVSFGRLFIANPDLVNRMKHGLSLADFNHKTLYTKGSAGYTDYSAISE